MLPPLGSCLGSLPSGSNILEFFNSLVTVESTELVESKANYGKTRLYCLRNMQPCVHKFICLHVIDCLTNTSYCHSRSCTHLNRHPFHHDITFWGVRQMNLTTLRK